MRYSKPAIAIVALVACATVKRPMSAPIVIPFELRGDLAIVQASVNGHPTRLILDTGSGAMVLDSAFVREAGVALTGQSAQANGARTTSVPLATARSVNLSQASLSDVLVAVVDLDDVRARVGHDVHGTIGYDLFNSYTVSVDYSTHTITLYAPDVYVNHAQGATVVPIQIEHRLPVLDASIVTRRNGVIPARLHLDLGSANYVLKLSTRFATEHVLASDTVTLVGPFGAGVGGITQGRLLRMPELRIGKLVLRRVSTALSEESSGALGANASTDGTVGAAMFRQGRIIVDYANSRVIIEPKGQLDTDSVDASGLTVIQQSDRPSAPFTVAYVVAGSARYSAGFHVGDEIVSIDHRPVSSLSLSDAKQLLRTAGTVRQITFRRGGTEATVSVPLRMIF